ncbi:uncharacterized protein LOC118794671 [Megalops cyprinoides]|uniref:uncharacterized protein LOC118794671 n=1 Tax=Megalops cyprinoides TaxID=118141 RepID=UPI001864B619|nr:uncharacterized protein LOC118794671 [Megalops cyprinoides]
MMVRPLKFFVFLLFSPSTWAEGIRSMRFLQLKPGEEFTVVCSTTLRDQEGLYLYHSLPDKKSVLYLDKDTYKLTPGGRFEHKLKTEGQLENFTVTISNLTEDDSGLYWCLYNKFVDHNMKTVQGDGQFTMLHVTVGPSPPSLTEGTPTASVKKEEGRAERAQVSSALVMVSALAAGAVVLLCIVILIVWGAPRVKRLCKRQQSFQPSPHEIVYEDMRLNRAP